MEFIKQWTVCTCVTLIIAAVFSVFSPSGKMQSFYKILISLFVFISFIYPLKDFKGFDFPENLTFQSENIYDERLHTYEKAVNEQIKNLLKENGITGADVNSILSLTGENDVSIDEVNVAVPDEYDKNYVEKLIFNELGIKAKVINTGE